MNVQKENRLKLFLDIVSNQQGTWTRDSKHLCLYMRDLYRSSTETHLLRSVINKARTPIKIVYQRRYGRKRHAAFESGAAGRVANKPDSPFAPPRRRRAKLRGVVRSLRGKPPFENGRRARVAASSSSRGLSIGCASLSAPSFRDLNFELPRLVYLLVLVSTVSVAAVLASVVIDAVVGLVRRAKPALAICGMKNNRLVGFGNRFITMRNVITS